MTQNSRLAYGVAETARLLHMPTPAVHEAIERGLIWAVTFFDETVVPAVEVERIRENVARRKQLEVEAQRPAAEGWRRRLKKHAWTFERQAPR